MVYSTMTWNEFILDMVLAMLIIAVLVWASGCNLVEINMVQRSTMDSGDGATSNRQEVTSDEDEDKLELIVPLK